MLVSFFDRSGNSPHRLARLWGKMLLAVSFIRVRAEGLESSTPSANYVFVANHASFMDIPALLSTLPLPVPLLRQERPLPDSLPGHGI